MILLAHACSLIWTSDLFLYMVVVAMAYSMTFYKMDGPQWFFIIWIIWCFLGIMVNPHPVLAIHGWMLRCEGFLTLVILTRAAWLYWSNYRDLVPLVYTGAGLCAFLIILDCVGMFHIPIMAVSGWIALAAVLIWVYEKPLLILVAPVVLMCTNRSCIIGIVAGILVAELLSKRWKLFVLGILMIAILSSVHPGIRQKFENVNLDSSGMGSRSQWIMQGVEITRKNPIFGCGFGTLSAHLRPAKGITAENNTWPDKTHNMAWDYIATTGVIGYILLLCSLGYAVGIVIKNRGVFSQDMVACLSALSAYIALGLFNPQGIPAHFIALTCLFGINRNRSDING